jgi:hypothetical protein
MLGWQAACHALDHRAWWPGVRADYDKPMLHALFLACVQLLIAAGGV